MLSGGYNKGDKRKNKICDFMAPVLSKGGGGGRGKLSGFLDSLHMFSCHIPIHSKALSATDREIIGEF